MSDSSSTQPAFPSEPITVSATTKAKSGYLPGLDGWRAIAILGVLMTHDTLSDFKPLHYAQSIGYMGVYLFFAISGLLLPWRMVENERVAGFFDIKGFYIRRVFRIQPALLGYLLCIAVLMAIGFLNDEWRYWFGSLFSYRNFQFHNADPWMRTYRSWFTGHFWSLSIEEHFYILLSFIFLVFKRNRLTIFFVCFVLLTAGQHYGRSHGLYSSDVSAQRTYWIVQYLLFATLLALSLQKQSIMAAAKRFLRPWLVFTSTGVLILADHLLEHRHESHNIVTILVVESTILFFAFGFWAASTMLHPQSWTTRLLETSPFRFIGRLSYSIYLWQQLFFWNNERLPNLTWKPFLWASRGPQHYIVVLTCAMVSYFLIEKPMIRLGHKLAPPATPGHRDLDVAPGLPNGENRA